MRGIMTPVSLSHAGPMIYIIKAAVSQVDFVIYKPGDAGTRD